jgi:hypothetical protein
MVPSGAAIVQTATDSITIAIGGLQQVFKDCVLTRSPIWCNELPASFIHSLAKIFFATDSHEPVLLVGATAYKSLLVDTYTQITGRSSELVRCYLSTDTEAADLLGQMKPFDMTTAMLQIADAAASFGVRLSALSAKGCDDGMIIDRVAKLHEAITEYNTAQSNSTEHTADTNNPDEMSTGHDVYNADDHDAFDVHSISSSSSDGIVDQPDVDSVTAAAAQSTVPDFLLDNMSTDDSASDSSDSSYQQVFAEDAMSSAQDFGASMIADADDYDSDDETANVQHTAGTGIDIVSDSSSDSHSSSGEHSNESNDPDMFSDICIGITLNTKDLMLQQLLHKCVSACGLLHEGCVQALRDANVIDSGCQQLLERMSKLISSVMQTSAAASTSAKSKKSNSSSSMPIFAFKEGPVVPAVLEGKVSSIT